jgi:hypothetical protein
MDDGEKVNAIKFYDLFDRVGCILFKVFTVYLRSHFCAAPRIVLDALLQRKFHFFSEILSQRALRRFQGIAIPSAKKVWR